MTKRRLCAIMVIVGGRRLASHTPTIIERERIRKIRRIFRVGGRKFADRTPTIIERKKIKKIRRIFRVGGRKFADRTPTIIEREKIRKIRRIFRVGGRRFADRTPTIIEKVFLRCLLLSCCRIMAKNGVWYCLNCSIMLCCACIRRSWKRRAIGVPNWDKRGRAFSPPVLAWRVDFFFGTTGIGSNTPMILIDFQEVEYDYSGEGGVGRRVCERH